MFFGKEIVNLVVIRMDRRAVTGRFVVEAAVDLVMLRDEQGKRDELIRKRIERNAARAVFRARIKVSVVLITVTIASLRTSNKRSGDPFGASCSVRSFVTNRVLYIVIVCRFGGQKRSVIRRSGCARLGGRRHGPTSSEKET